MKFSATLLLLASLVSAHGDEHHGNSTAPATCMSSIECKLNELKNNKDAAKKFEACGAKTDEAEITKCVFAALGLKDQQIEKLGKLQKSIASCTPTEEKITALAPCFEKCTGAKQEECAGKCMQPLVVEYGTCVKKLAGKPDLDLAKLSECSKTKCTQSTLSEVFDCDYTCNKELYDALISKSGNSGNSTEKSDKEGNGKEETAKDGKSGSSGTSSSSAEKPKGGNASAMTNFGMSSFGAIAVGTALFTLLV